MTDPRCRHVRQHIVALPNGLRSQRCVACGWEIARLPSEPDPTLSDDELLDVAAERRRRLLAGWPLNSNAERDR
jgi:hypothetical protein